MEFRLIIKYVCYYAPLYISVKTYLASRYSVGLTVIKDSIVQHCSDFSLEINKCLKAILTGTNSLFWRSDNLVQNRLPDVGNGSTLYLSLIQTNVTRGDSLVQNHMRHSYKNPNSHKV